MEKDFNIIIFIIRLILSFIKNVWGIVQAPYATYRRLVNGDSYELLIIFFFIGLYFFFVSPLKLHTFHPFLLTIKASRLFTSVIATFIAICLFLLILGRLIGRDVKLNAVLMTWGYSLIPTLIWFFATSVFYVILPPPRHETLLGRSFSLLFLTFSLSLLFWKGLLYYLTLRFALKLDLWRIIVVSLVFFPTLSVYSLVLYKLGIFKVPFI